MFPTIYSIGPFTIYSYGLMLAAAVLVCSWLLRRDAAAYQIKAGTVYDLVFACVLGGILGARLFYIVLNLDYFRDNLAEIVMLQNGGLAWQGGLVFGAGAAILYLLKQKIPLAFMADLAAPYLALGQAIGRLGCFLNGCCYGRPVAWGIYFPLHQMRLHPTQLYDSAGLFLIFIFLKAARRKAAAPGQIFAAYLISAAALRFVVEFFRADHSEIVAGLSIFQLVSLGIIAAGIIILARVRPSSARSSQG